MKRQNEILYGLPFILIMIIVVFATIYPWSSSHSDEQPNKASVNRAVKHIKTIAEKPHFVGSKNHEKVREYLQAELQKITCDVQRQEGSTLTEWGNLVPVSNILARIKGTENGKALLVMAHYDSAPHSASHGAADDGVGLATILEGLRAFKIKNKSHKNDIIVLFTDGEELGLNGAALFVNEHPWAKKVGLAVNFEARGTGGPSYMLLETAGGNQELINCFKEANPTFPIASSLMYSIYKLMPNDTDLTVLRENGNIPGFNFAFIDDHFYYHTAKDQVNQIDRKSIAHQLDYLNAMLDYFSNKKLNKLNSAEDSVYFNIPFGLISYPFSWNYPILIVSCFLFLFFLFIGLGRRSILIHQIGKGFLLFVLLLTTVGGLTFFIWKAILNFYPEYNEILQGFTYNGHAYILAFILLALSICFLFYFKIKSNVTFYSYLVTPILIWLLINFFLVTKLPGAAFFIWPVLASIVSLGVYCIFEKNKIILHLALALPSLFIFLPLIYILPIGLGLKLLFASTLLVGLVFGLLLPLFGNWNGKLFLSAVLFFSSFCCFIYAHCNAPFNSVCPKPNSLVYWYDTNTNEAFYATYDIVLDNWTKLKLGEKPKNSALLNKNRLFSKYGNSFTFCKKTTPIAISAPNVSIMRDSTTQKWRHLKMLITPNRNVNRYDVFAPEQLSLHNLRANGTRKSGEKKSLYAREGKKILSYYVVNNLPLTLEFSIPKEQQPNLEIVESSFDLLSNKQINMPSRAAWMMPKPFVLTDAIIVKMKINAPIKTSKIRVKKENQIPQTPDSIAAEAPADFVKDSLAP